METFETRRNNERTNVQGDKVTLSGRKWFDKFRFFAYNNKREGWFVIEMSTGAACASCEDTKKAAIEAAELNLRQVGLKKMKESLKDAMPMTGEYNTSH